MSSMTKHDAVPKLRFSYMSRLVNGYRSHNVSIDFAKFTDQASNSLDQNQYTNKSVTEKESAIAVDSYESTKTLHRLVKLGSIDETRSVFDQMHRFDTIVWNIMIGGYVNIGFAIAGINTFVQMQQEGIRPDQVTVVHVLNACASLSDAESGRKIHLYIINGLVQPNVYVFNALIDMYVKAGMTVVALKVLEEEHEINVVSYNALMAGYSKEGLANECVELLDRMHREGIKPNQITFVYALKAHACLGNLDLGNKIYSRLLRNNVQMNVFLGNALIDMYCKCGDMSRACQVFNEMDVRDVVTWNALMGVYVKYGPHVYVFNIYEKMQIGGIRPSPVTFLYLLNTCGRLCNLRRGQEIHSDILSLGIKLDINMWNTVMDMYLKCGRIRDAKYLFAIMPKRDVVSWNVLLMGCAKEGLTEYAFRMFSRLRQEGVKPNTTTYLSLLIACASFSMLERGQYIHSQVIEDEFGSEAFLGSALVDMYSKSGNLDDAFHVMDKLPTKDTVTWNALITGYAMFGQVIKVANLVEQMQTEGADLDCVTVLAMVSACSFAGYINEGYRIFADMSRYGYTLTMEQNASIVDLLGRSGSLDEAVWFVDKLPCQPGVPVWLSLLSACRIYAHIELAEFITNWFLNLERDVIGNYVLLSNLYVAAEKWED